MCTITNTGTPIFHDGRRQRSKRPLVMPFGEINKHTSASPGIHSMFQTKLPLFFRTTNKTPAPTTPRGKRLIGIPTSYCLPWILETPNVPVEEVRVECRALKCFWRPCPSSFPLLVFHWPTSSFAVSGREGLQTTSPFPRLSFPL